MTAPTGVTIGATWTPKRGKRADDLTIVQIHRADRACTVRDCHGRHVLRWSAMRKTWRPAA